MKSDRKLDILSRTMNTPAVERTKQRRPDTQSRTHLESTPEIDMDTSMDTSVDVSFVSADDESVIEGSVSPLSRTSRRGRLSDITDPFVANSSLRHEIAAEDEGSDEGDSTASELDNVSTGLRFQDDFRTKADTQSRVSDLTQEEDASFRFKPTSKLLAGLKKIDQGDVSIDSANTEESEDVLGDMSAEIPAADDNSVTYSAVDDVSVDVEEEDDEGVEEEEEDVEDDDDEDELEDSETDLEESDVESEADSDFEAAEDKSISSASPSPPRRLSTKRRPTVSPTKLATPAKNARSVKPVKAKKTSPAKRVSTGQVKDDDLLSPRALQERTRQDSVADQSNSDDEVQVAKPKKKR